MPGRGPGSQASAKQKKDNQEEVSLPGDQVLVLVVVYVY